MKLIFEGRKDKINTLVRLNKNYASRNGVKITLGSEPKKDIDKKDDEQIKSFDTTKRVRRTKAEIEAEKLKK